VPSGPRATAKQLGPAPTLPNPTPEITHR
jgi:hypothetical protein